MASSTERAASLASAIRPERLRRWVVVLGVLAILGNAGTDAYNQWRAYRFAIADTSRELVNAAGILAAQTQGTVKIVDVLLRDVVDGYPRLKPAAPPGDLNAFLAGRVEGLPQLFALTISDAEGVERYRSRAFDEDRHPNINDRSYFIAQRDNPKLGLFVSEPIVTRRDHRLVIVLSRRLTDDSGRFAGVVSGVIDLDEFQRFYHQIKLGNRSAILLLRDDGTLVVREPAVPSRIGKVFPGLAQLPSEGATRMDSSVDGVRRFVAGAHADGFPLVVAVSREEGAVFGPWRGELVRVVTQDVILTALIALAIAVLVHQLRRVELGERALRESESRYALAMEGANEGHFDWNLRGGGGFMSPKMRELLGVGDDVSIDTRADAIVNVHADDRPRIDAALHEHLGGHSERYEVEYRVRRADGEWHWLLVRGRCVRNAEGDPSRLVGSAIDVTERKHAESEKDRLETQLRKSQKLEAMGTLAGGIAHDFNNILGAIVGYGEMAQRSAAAGSAVRRYIDNVMQAAGRAKALVESVLAFSRSGVGERTPVNVQTVIAETLQLLAASLPGRVRLESKLDAGDAGVIGDATQLHQLAMNLCTNAVQAMPAGGVLEVRLEQLLVHERRSVFHGVLAPAPYVRLVVRDTGTGIEPYVLDRMFDPFFTTKGVGAGTGLGLSLVHGIVADMGGAIDVASVLDEGTTFTIWLPVTGRAPRAEAEVPNDVPHGHGEVIMVVDDEVPLVALAEEMLAGLGYEPVGFESSKAALKAFADDPGRFDAVLTDEKMPELTGTALAGEIHRVRSDIPIVIMSGYVDSDVELAPSCGVREVLRKPLKARDIAEAIDRVLPASPATMAGATRSPPRSSSPA
jgi:PAS domain S-box-containing protein